MLSVSLWMRRREDYRGGGSNVIRVFVDEEKGRL